MFKKISKAKFRINGTFTAEQIACILRENAADYFIRGEAITSPDKFKGYISATLSHLEYEAFTVVLMDNRNRVIATELMFRGTIDGASVYPREVVKMSLEHNAAAVILAHNHPSGITEPSKADIALTKRLKEALALVDVRVLDHFIVGEDGPESMSERGLI